MDQLELNTFIQGCDRIASRIVGAIHRVSGMSNPSQDVYPFIMLPEETLPLTLAGNGTGILNYIIPANTTFYLQYFMHQVTSELVTGSIRIDASRISLMNNQALIEAFSNTIDVTDANERTLWKLPIPVNFTGPANFSVDFTDLSGSTNAIKLYAIGVRDNRRQALASGTHSRAIVPVNNIQGSLDF